MDGMYDAYSWPVRDSSLIVNQPEQQAMKPIVIVGTGLAGYTTAREFRRHDSETPLVIVSADDATSYSKPMLSTAKTRGKSPDDLAQAGADAAAAQHGADVQPHTRVTGLDAERRIVHLADGQSLEAAAIVLGIGADQIDPGLDGDAADAVFAVNDLGAYRDLRAALDAARRVVIIGGGLIGCEFANDWVRAGHAVTVIEPLAHPLGRMLPPAAGAALAASLRADGVEFATGHFATRVDRAGDGLEVTRDDGRVFGADVVVRAIGLQPRTALAAAAGLDVGRGIRTDRTLTTSAPGIHALGDCAEVDGLVLPFIMPINQCARALGATLAGTPTPVEYPVMPVIVKTPACPVQLYPPPAGVEGAWAETELDGGTRSLFHDGRGRLRGFALTGGAVREKGELAARVPGYFANREL